MFVRDLTSKRALCLKAALFIVAAVLAGAILLARTPEWSSLLLLTLCIWSAARAYYFAALRSPSAYAPRRNDGEICSEITRAAAASEMVFSTP